MCGADYVKTTQRLPPSLADKLKPGQRACSYDGDADRLMYFFLDERGYFQMLDGDKIAGLVATFIMDLVRLSGLDKHLKVGLIQTAYANGASTKFLSDVRFPYASRSPCIDSRSAYLSNVFLLVLNIFTMQRNTMTLVFISRQTVMEPFFSLGTL